MNIEIISKLVEKFGVAVIGFIFCGIVYVDFKNSMKDLIAQNVQRIEATERSVQELKISNQIQLLRIENLEKIKEQ